MRQSGQQARLASMQNDRDSEVAVLFVLPQRMIHAWTCCVTDSAAGAPRDHVCDQHKYSITRGTWCRAPCIIHADGSRQRLRYFLARRDMRVEEGPAFARI